MSACGLPASRRKPTRNPHSSAEQPGRIHNALATCQCDVCLCHTPRLHISHACLMQGCQRWPLHFLQSCSGCVCTKQSVPYLSPIPSGGSAICQALCTQPSPTGPITSATWPCVSVEAPACLILLFVFSLPLLIKALKHKQRGGVTFRLRFGIEVDHLGSTAMWQSEELLWL